MKIITIAFFNNGAPALGLTPTINIYELTTISNTQVVTNGACTEIAQGLYRYNFTTYDGMKNYAFVVDGGNTLSDFDRYKYGGNESYVEEISSQVWEEDIGDHLNVDTTGFTLSQINSNVETIAITEVTIVNLLELILKYHRNRTRIDKNLKTLTVYDDDNISPLTVFDLKDFAGSPSILEVCERISQ